MMSDDALGRFAVTIVPAAGVLLAALVSILVFLMGRVAADRRVAVERAMPAAQLVRRHLIDNHELSEEYLRGSVSDDLRRILSTMALLEPEDELPDYFQWSQAIAPFRSQDLAILIGSPTAHKDERVLAFGDQLNGLIMPLEAAIIDHQVQVIDRKNVGWLMRGGVVSMATLLLGSLTTALVTDLQIEEVIPESWNAYIAATFLVIFIVSVAFFVIAILATGVRRARLSTVTPAQITATAQRIVDQERAESDESPPETPSPAAR